VCAHHPEFNGSKAARNADRVSRLLEIIFGEAISVGIQRDYVGAGLPVAKKTQQDTAQGITMAAEPQLAQGVDWRELFNTVATRILEEIENKREKDKS
jgi:hypothetical protein